MDSYQHLELSTSHATGSAPHSFSRRQLAIALLSRLSLYGLLPASPRESAPAAKSDAFPILASYDTPQDVITAVARRQCLRRHLRKRRAPEVGIFWFIQEAGRAPELFGSSVPLPEGKAYGVYIDGPEDHVTFWRTIKRMTSALPADCGPKDWPRGRVLFNTAMKHFEVNINQQLLAPGFRTEILDYFRLPKTSTVFIPDDPHYAQTRFTVGPHGPHERGLLS